MNRNPGTSLSEDEIHTLIDAQASGDTLAALQARLAQDPDAQRTAAQWQQQRASLKGLHQQLLDQPIPASLLAAAQQTAASQKDIMQWWRWGGMAAGVMMAFGVGWLSHAQWHDRPSEARLEKLPATLAFARQASVAYAVYAPEVRHPVEVSAAEQEHLVQWLSKRLGKPLKIPSLTTEGYELVGGRLLPGDTGARAQFMFQNTAGTRITLYLGAVGKDSDSAARETAFRFAADGPVASFYWVDQGFGYALTGPVPRDALMKLSEAVYRQR